MAKNIHRPKCEDFGTAMKRIEEPEHCGRCARFHQCMTISTLRVVAELHDMVGVVLVNAGLAKGVAADGREVGRRRIVLPKAPIDPHGSPGKPD